jgi:hypothetical protein
MTTLGHHSLHYPTSTYLVLSCQEESRIGASFVRCYPTLTYIQRAKEKTKRRKEKPRLVYGKC